MENVRATAYNYTAPRGMSLSDFRRESGCCRG